MSGPDAPQGGHKRRGGPRGKGRGGRPGGKGGGRGGPGNKGPQGQGGKGGGKPRGKYTPETFPRTWRSRFGVLTENAVPGVRVYGEKLFSHGERELRTWNPRRSKLAALVMTGTNALKLEGDETVLYLGAASGTTVSHLSDILASGEVLAVEKSPRSFRDLIDLARMRENVLPLLSDAEDTDSLTPVAADGVDIVYQDIAQREQARIFIKNCVRFLKPGGTGVLMVKARSINLALPTNEIYDQVETLLRDAGLKVWERKNLEPYEKDHAALVVHKPEDAA